MLLLLILSSANLCLFIISFVYIKIIVTSLNNSLEKHVSINIQRVLDAIDMQFKTISMQNHDINKDIEARFNAIYSNIDDKFYKLQRDSGEKLEIIRQTVDEKLHETLETRLGQTFQIVADRLEKMHQGIGEMHNLANGVGDLKKILTNVKTRGVWGEAQLHAILEQLLTPSQYLKNVRIKAESAESVEFAIKLPSKHDDSNILLPIDAKLPLDIYQRLLSAHEASCAEDVQLYTKELLYAVKKQAKLIAGKYIEPPITTDFAIMFIPIEGLYAEILRITGLLELLQQEFKIIVAGPTTLSAILNTLQIGYRAIAVQKHSNEVSKMLTIVRKEFAKFSDLLGKTRIKLDQASKSIGDAQNKSHNIQKELKSIEMGSLDYDVAKPL